MTKKSKTKEDKQWLSDVAELGCICCRNMGYGATLAEIHHVRTGQGMAQRASHKDVLPLCPHHHRPSYDTGFHAAPKTWQEIHGTEIELLEQIKKEVMELRACRV
ncbi:Ref family recombination enhancement nuclease [Providencia rettgeri]|uniref:Ref family recombination enhancement nuclease n=1 Tax=Providencia rettgeri TaxID=587 RepID=UPI001EE77A8B|nr:Ref family recombination enhancement nuclease [Providencia rettgeri]MCG5378749.1 Ref family protein [Providencia rettgeri]